jgi:transposase
MKKTSTAVAKQSRNISQQKLTIGLDLGDRNSWFCVLDEAGGIQLEQRVRTTAEALQEVFGAMPRSRIALEIGTHSPWISRLLKQLGHEVIVANARKVRLIGESRKKDDRLDAQTLARLARIDPELLYPVKHRSGQAQADLMMIRARASLVRARTGLVNAARGLAKSYGERLRGCNVRNLNPEKAETLSPELQRALEPLLAAIEEVSARICEYNDRIEALAQQSYPQVALLKQIKGVGTLIALTFLLTLEDPRRFRKSRDVGCYLGLQPGRRNSGQSEPQMHISKEGDPYLRTLLVQGAQHILGPFGVDCDLRRWGLKLAARGGRNGKKRAIVATARKLAVLLHHLWLSGEVYEPLHNSSRMTIAAAA